jgi:hypothetical protein
MSRVCTKCKQTKSLNEFSKCKNGKFGLQPKCKQCNKITSEKFRKLNPNYIKQHYLDNKELYKNNHKCYVENNKKQIQNYLNQYNKNLRQDPIEKLKHNLRIATIRGIKNKEKHSLEIIGLENWDLLKEHIEKQFTEGMTWDNWGIGKNNTTWHIDHITPLSSAQTEDEVYKLNHYTNLRPMWGSDNIRKKDKI